MKFLYLVECQSLYKIGITANLKRRLFTMQTGNPFQLTLLASFEFFNAKIAEHFLQAYFAKFHYKREWFLFKQENIIEFLKLCHELGGKEVQINTIEQIIEEYNYKPERLEDDET